MSNFGGLTDHFGIAALSAQLELISSSEHTIEQSRADALDENGDIAATQYFGNTTKDLRDVSCTYVIKGGTFNINLIKLGALAASSTVLRESISVSTSNSEFPQITVNGKKNIFAIVAPSGKLNTFTLPSFTLAGANRAQPMALTTGNGRLIACSLEASLEMAQQDNGVGEPIAFGVSGGTGSITAELVRLASLPTITVVTAGNSAFGLTQTKTRGLEEPQAAFHTASFSIGFTISRDNA
jgi:hypothetical protein